MTSTSTVLQVDAKQKKHFFFKYTKSTMNFNSKQFTYVFYTMCMPAASLHIYSRVGIFK